MDMSGLQTKLLKGASSAGKKSFALVRRYGLLGTGYMKAEIKRMDAIDTSVMLNSVHAEYPSKTEARIGPTPYYSVYVALGTSRMPARPFHETSARLLEAKISKDTKKGLSWL